MDLPITTIERGLIPLKGLTLGANWSWIKIQEDITVNISVIDPYIKEAFCWSDGNGWNAWTPISMRSHYLHPHSAKTSAVVSADPLVLWITKRTQTCLIHYRYALEIKPRILSFVILQKCKSNGPFRLLCFVFSMQTKRCSQENWHFVFSYIMLSGVEHKQIGWYKVNVARRYNERSIKPQQQQEFS